MAARHSVPVGGSAASGNAVTRVAVVTHAALLPAAAPGSQDAEEHVYGGPIPLYSPVVVQAKKTSSISIEKKGTKEQALPTSLCLEFTVEAKIIARKT